MSRRSASDQMGEDLAVGCIVGIFLALWAAIASAIIVIVKAFQKSPEDQLRKMEAQKVYGAQIAGQPCPVCEEPNEETAALCFHCGSNMSPSPKLPAVIDSETIERYRVALGKFAARPSRIRAGKTYMDAEIPIAIVVGVGLILLLLFLSALF